MGFNKDRIKTNYSTDKDNVLSQFYIPVLSEAKSYDRAVGYFTTSGLITFLRGVGGLVENDGKMRLVIGDTITDDEYTAINSTDNYGQIFSKLDEKWSEFIDQEPSELKKHRLEVFSWLYNRGFLQIKYAFRRKGLFHKKIGVITDANDEIIVFAGSNNETESALISSRDNPDGNSEEFDVYTSWKKESFEDHGKAKIESFNRVWNNEETNTYTVDLPSEHYEKIRSIYTSEYPPNNNNAEKKQAELFDRLNNKTRIKIPSHIELRGYQTDVINGWFKKKGKGVMQMATGTGKTITAISAATMFVEKKELDMLVVICPYKHLVTQWVKDLEGFNFKPISAYKSKKKWLKKLSDALSYSTDECICVVTTSNTFISEAFQNLIVRFPSKTLVIGDEVHNYGSTVMTQNLPESVRYRIGLSATPERHMDSSGTDAVFDYFGSIIEPIITLKYALDPKVGALTPYYYHPILTELNDEEYDEYEEITRKISRLAAMGHSLDDKGGSPISLLLIKRARITASCQNKIYELEKIMKKLMETSKPNKFLVYCGDGKVDAEADGQEERQIEAVTRLLGNDLELNVSTYTFDTSTEDREKMQLELASGERDGIVAIRCLDEGVDIPVIDLAFILASSSNPKQFIQRRGRVLRTAKHKKYATIYDFVVMPPGGLEVIEMDKKIVERELKRCIEFANLAKNKFEATNVLSEITDKYNLYL